MKRSARSWMREAGRSHSAYDRFSYSARLKKGRSFEREFVHADDHERGESLAHVPPPARSASPSRQASSRSVRADPRSDQFDELLVLRKALLSQFGEDQLPVHRDLETPTRRGDQSDLTDLKFVLVQKQLHRTGGSSTISSARAVFDPNPRLHGRSPLASVPTIRRRSLLGVTDRSRHP